MLNKEQVLGALDHLIDPKLSKPMNVHNQIRDVLVKDAEVRLTMTLYSVDEELKAALTQQAEQALTAIGASSVHLRFRALSEIEIADVRKRESGESTADSNADAEGLDTMQKQRRAELAAQPKGIPPLLSAESKTNFLAIASGKGGVGKSTVTVNLAVALARRGKKVGIMDCDIYGFSIPDMLGLEGRPELEGEKITPPERYGVKVISMGFFVEDNSPVIWRGPMLGKMIRNFFNEVEWGELDYLLLDLPPGTGDVALDIHQMIPQSKEVIVTTPHATAAFVAARAGAMAQHTKHEIVGVVENMAYYECGDCGKKEYVFGRGGGAKLASELHTDLLAQIPLGAPDNHPSEADYSPSVYKEDTATGQIYLEMADRVIGE
jgi:ATP-binding protein involved in chromosome partitioning